MLKNLNKYIEQKGSMMIEAIALLGLITMVTPILYKKAAERTAELQDISSAGQVRSLVKAMDEYIVTNYSSLATKLVGKNYHVLTDAEHASVKEYLPYGFMANTGRNKAFKGYKISVRKQDIGGGKVSLTGLVALPAATDVNQVRISKLASMIGGNGGLVVKNGIAQGVQGGWQAAVADYGLTAAEYKKPGTIVATSINSVSSNSAGGMEKVLFREFTGDINLNTMKTELLMNQNKLSGLNKLIAFQKDITIEAKDAADVNLTITGAATVSKTLKAINQKFSLTGGAGATDTNDGVLTMKGSADIKTDLDVGTSLDVASVLNVTKDTLTMKKAGGATQLVVGAGNLKMTGTTDVTGTLKAAASSLTGVDYKFIVDNKKLSMTGDIHAKRTSAKATDGNLIADNSITGKNLHAKGVGPLAGNVTADYNSYAKHDIYASLPSGQTADTSYINKMTADGITTKKDFSAVEGQVTAEALGVGGVAFKVHRTKNDHDLFSIQGKADLTSTATIHTSTANLKADGVVNVTGGASVDVTSPLANFRTDKFRIINDANNVEYFALDRTANTNAGSATFKVQDAKFFGKNFEVNDSATGNDKILKVTSGAYNASDKASIYMRKGLIEVEGDTTPGSYEVANNSYEGEPIGYIKADRMIAGQGNASTLNPSSVYGSVTYADSGTKYDKYQVNPAYTSVMHDIKLTTRGGARLSEVLPDFINKGFYVIDNTYKELHGTNPVDWRGGGTEVIDFAKLKAGRADLAVKPGFACTENDMNCATTPWLGFIPAPLCPPGYAKVITINPIRWKMSEAYRVADVPISSAVGPRSWLEKVSYPRRFSTNVTIDPASSGGVGHDHHAEIDIDYSARSNLPFTFQTNTWLNTTVEGVGTQKGTLGNHTYDPFYGWSAIMGFLYDSGVYSEYLSAAGISYTSGHFIWNLFPVYYQELTAVADVYCYFERRYGKANWNNNLVDTGYNQLSNTYQTEKSKKSDYYKRLNDPNLKYQEQW